MTGDLKATMKPGLSNFQSELGLGMEVPNRMNSLPLRGAQKKRRKKKYTQGEEEGGGRGGNKLNPVKLFFHSHWAWQRPLTNTHKM